MMQDELCSAVRSLYRATGLPIIVDGDTGYGEALNVMRLVRELEAAGAAAVQLALLELEIAGRLERHAAGRVSLR